MASEHALDFRTPLILVLHLPFWKILHNLCCLILLYPNFNCGFLMSLSFPWLQLPSALVSMCCVMLSSQISHESPGIEQITLVYFSLMADEKAQANALVMSPSHDMTLVATMSGEKECGELPTPSLLPSTLQWHLSVPQPKLDILPNRTARTFGSYIMCPGMRCIWWVLSISTTPTIYQQLTKWYVYLRPLLWPPDLFNMSLTQMIYGDKIICWKED